MKLISVLLASLLFHLSMVAAPTFSEKPKTTRLFSGKAMDHWEPVHPNGWLLQDETLTPNREYRKNNYLWTNNAYEDFILTLQYKLSEGANSGVFIRANQVDPVQQGIEIQLLDGPSKQAQDGELDKHSNGAIYDTVAPSSYNNRPAGEWNALLIYARGSKIAVYVNGDPVASADLKRWTSAGYNPDGTRHKFKKPLATLPHAGKIGLQYHGKPVQFRDITVTELENHSPDLTHPTARRPNNENELQFWLKNMVEYHRFSESEIALATGLNSEEIDAAIQRFGITKSTAPRQKKGPLLTLPYPGGRHPRIGFLDGAIDPQRETKLSIFLPWDNTTYVVADVPEAIFTNLGLTYLAHTHVPTIWNESGTNLEPLEWQRNADGSYEITRVLPNNISYTTQAVPTEEAVHFRITLHNGSDETLTDQRLQNCVMLRGAPDFADLTTENRVLKKPYAAVHNRTQDRWVITAWEPHLRFTGNRYCPCLHSDPYLPDCPPGETVSTHGILTFYEGTDIDAETTRIDETEWRTFFD